MFQLISLTINEGCRYSRVLKPGTYCLSSMGAEWGDFFGKGIMVSAVVGKNGSGKSSLLEMIFRIINNVNAYLCSHLIRKEIPPVYFIEGISASLKYRIDEYVYEINCDNRNVIISTYLNGDCVETFNLTEKYPFKDKPLNMQKRVEKLSRLFYTVALNYSGLAYNETEYAQETISTINRYHVFSDANYNANWLHNIFHKNDGYSVSINLNPFRSEGTINANTELYLSRARLVALLAMYPKKMMSDYVLSSIEYWYNENYFKDKLKKENILDKDGTLIRDTLHVATLKNSCCNILLSKLLGVELNLSTMYHKSACFYICLKALIIISKYPLYEEYTSMLSVELLTKEGNQEQKKAMSRYADALKSDMSHIALKIRQTIHFYKAISNDPDLVDFLGDIRKSKIFEYYDFKKSCRDKNPKNIEQQMNLLPPPFFNVKIYLNKQGEDKRTKIPLSQLSTGERQFIYAAASIIYHLVNIKSVPSRRDRIHYRKVLVVLDEAELSYHPEYQRVFIKNLIDLILRLRLTRVLNIHFLITTHSPFMLSDIPKCNVLYLQNGKDVSKKMKSPFCANISDLLADSFFLSENGVIGEFAKDKVLEIVNALENSTLKRVQDKYTSESLRLMIESIGESLIKEGLMELYFKSNFAHQQDRVREIQELRQRIESLEKEL